MTPEQLHAKVATDIAKRIALVVRDVCELPDRTSPDDWPEAMIVTPGELTLILIKRFGTPDQPAATAFPEFERGGAEAIIFDGTAEVIVMPSDPQAVSPRPLQTDEGHKKG